MRICGKKHVVYGNTSTTGTSKWYEQQLYLTELHLTAVTLAMPSALSLCIVNL
jgi:hypothetical protein